MRPLVVLLVVLAACGPGIDRQATLDRFREATDVEVDDAERLAELNALVTQVSEAALLQGLYRDEVAAAIGPGRRCGSDPLCSRRGFSGDDLVYAVGQRRGMPVGPLLLVGFDGSGRCDATFALRREDDLALPPDVD